MPEATYQSRRQLQLQELQEPDVVVEILDRHDREVDVRVKSTDRVQRRFRRQSPGDAVDKLHLALRNQPGLGGQVHELQWREQEIRRVVGTNIAPDYLRSVRRID